MHLAALLALSANVGQVQIGTGRGELPVATLTHPSGATAEVYLHGAHVTSWRPADGVERLFVSSASRYAAGKAIRGGIPVCFPQFSGRGPLPNHGFARTSSDWQVESTSSDGPGGEVCLVLRLSDSAETRAVWPHAFELRYTVTLRDASLSTDVQLRNAGGEPLEFTAALHTYLATPQVGTAAVAGLAGLRYEDNAEGGAAHTELAEEVRVRGEVDRVYLDAPDLLQLRHEGPAVELTKRNLRDVVLWNIGGEKAAAMADLGPGEWQRYICLEAGAVGSAVRVLPGETFAAGQTLSSSCAAPTEAS